MFPVENILSGVELLFSSSNLLYVTVGLILGFVVGVLPGFGGANAAAIALPFTIGLPIEAALLLMVGIYAGAGFGGAVPAILLNVPGTAGAAATAIDGYPMAQQGKAELAIGVARMASAFGGAVAATLVLFIIGPMSTLAQTFGLRELFVISMMGLALIAGVVGENFKKGLIAAVLGLLVSMMSGSPITAHARWTLGFPELYEGVPFIPALIGLFAFTQMFVVSRQETFLDDVDVQGEPVVLEKHGWRHSMSEVWEGVRTTLSFPGHLIRGTMLGAFIGAIPGVGAVVANFMSYGIAQQTSKHPERFGKGSAEGIIASETADNGVAAGTLVPTLTLGIPGSGTAAIMIAALWLHGIRPGPQVTQTHTAEVYAVILGLLFASVLILPLGILLGSPLAQITRARPRYIVVFMLLLATVGAFGYRNSLFDVGLAFVFGLVGYGMRHAGYPVVPFVLALVLGPLAEGSLIRALSIAQFDPLYMFQSRTSQVLWVMFIVILGYLSYASWKGRRGTARIETEEAGTEGAQNVDEFGDDHSDKDEHHDHVQDRR